MIRKFFIFVFLLGVGAVVMLNYKSLMAMGQERIVSQQAEGAISVQNWEKAINLYEQAHHEHPGNARISLRLAWLKLMAEQPAEAETIYRDILKSEPGQLEASMGLAAILDNDPRHINQAVLLLRDALKSHPNDSHLIAETGNVYKIAADNPQETRQDTKKWLYDLAIYYYQASLKLNPRQFQTQFNLGVSSQAVEQPQQAAQAYCKAIGLNPKSYEARYNLGLALSELNFQSEAYRQMDAAVKLLGEDDMESAQALAVKVQNVKNGVFNSGDKGLSSNENPDFLDKACLAQTAAEPDSK